MVQEKILLPLQDRQIQVRFGMENLMKKEKTKQKKPLANLAIAFNHSVHNSYSGSIFL